MPVIDASGDSDGVSDAEAARRRKRAQRDTAPVPGEDTPGGSAGDDGGSDPIRDLRGAGRDETRDAGTVDDTAPESPEADVDTAPESPEADVDTAQENPEVVSRAAGLPSTPGDPAEETEGRVEDALAQAAVDQSPIFTDPSQVEVVDVRQMEDGQFTGTVEPTLGGRLSRGIYSRESAERRGPQTDIFRENEKERAARAERRLWRQTVEREARTDQFARRKLREGVTSRSDDMTWRDVDVSFNDGVQTGLTTGGESRARVRDAAKRSEFEAGELRVDVAGGRQVVRPTDEAARRRAAAGMEGVAPDDLRIVERTNVAPSDIGLFNRGDIDDVAVSGDGRTGGTSRGFELTPDKRAQMLYDRARSDHPNAEIAFYFDEETGDPYAEIREEGMLEGTARVIGDAWSSPGMTASGPGGVGPGVATFPISPGESAELSSNAARTTVEGAAAIGADFQEELDRDINTVSSMVEYDRVGGPRGLGPGVAFVAPSDEAYGAARDIAATDVVSAAVSIPGEFVEGGEDIADNAVSGAERDLNTIFDTISGNEVPTGPGNSFVGRVAGTTRELAATVPLAAPAATVGAGAAAAEPTPFGEVGYGALGVGIVGGVALGTGAALGARELDRATRSTSVKRAGEVGVGAPNTDISEIDQPAEPAYMPAELGSPETTASSRPEIPAPAEPVVSAPEIGAPAEPVDRAPEIDVGEGVVRGPISTGATAAGGTAVDGGPGWSLPTPEEAGRPEATVDDEPPVRDERDVGVSAGIIGRGTEVREEPSEATEPVARDAGTASVGYPGALSWGGSLAAGAGFPGAQARRRKAASSQAGVFSGADVTTDATSQAEIQSYPTAPDVGFENGAGFGSTTESAPDYWTPNFTVNAGGDPGTRRLDRPEDSDQEAGDPPGGWSTNWGANRDGRDALAVGYVAETYADLTFGGGRIESSQTSRASLEEQDPQPFGELIPSFSASEEEDFEETLDWFGV